MNEAKLTELKQFLRMRQLRDPRCDCENCHIIMDQLLIQSVDDKELTDLWYGADEHRWYS